MVTCAILACNYLRFRAWLLAVNQYSPTRLICLLFLQSAVILACKNCTWTIALRSRKCTGVYFVQRHLYKCGWHGSKLDIVWVDMRWGEVSFVVTHVCQFDNRWICKADSSGILFLYGQLQRSHHHSTRLCHIYRLRITYVIGPPFHPCFVSLSCETLA